MRLDYQSRKYAFLNSGIEVERHFLVEHLLMTAGIARRSLRNGDETG